MLKGIDNIHKYSKLLMGKRIGLVTSISGVDNQLNSTIEIINKNFNLQVLFAPEHGVRGDRDAGQMVDDYIDNVTGVPVYSLYKKDSKRLNKEMLDKVDVVVYDIQDLGVRYYTFISTLIYVMEDCAKEGKQFIVLDRPNPLGGIIVEGNVLEPAYKSFVGVYPIATRYGLTAGELAHMVNEEENIRCNLEVIPCTGWKRSQMFHQTDQIWVMPSLGIPRFDTALLYPGVCLAEGTNLSEGRGTSCPFEILGAPFINAQLLVDKLKDKELEGVGFTPAYFKPTSSKFKGVFCNGVHLHITDYGTFESYKTGLTVIETIRNMYPKDFEFLKPIEGNKKPFISLLSGNNAFENPEWTCDEILEKNEKELEEFKRKKQKYHIYE